MHHSHKEADEFNAPKLASVAPADDDAILPDLDQLTAPSPPDSEAAATSFEQRRQPQQFFITPKRPSFFDDLKQPDDVDLVENAADAAPAPLVASVGGVTSAGTLPQPGAGNIVRAPHFKRAAPAAQAAVDAACRLPAPGCFRCLGEGDVIIIYAHGNSETRSQYHRRELYQLYQNMGYYVLAFDYRGYADSTYLFPNEDTMAEDAVAAIRYVHKELIQKSRPKIIVHGHSLGTGVSCRVGAILAGTSRGYSV